MLAMKEEINKFCKDIYKDNKKKGFWKDRENIPYRLDYEITDNTGYPEFGEDEIIAVQKAFNAQMLALIHSEISEALEADRKDLMDDKLPHRKGLEVELADAAIRIFDMAGGLDLDLGGAIVEKLEFNRKRPFKHGKSY